MRHTKKKVLDRIIREYSLLDSLVSGFTDLEWNALLTRPESKDPWTVKDALAHIVYWKSEAVRILKRQPKPEAERGLNATKVNHIVFLRWHSRPPQDVLAWHRQLQEEVVAALQGKPEEWFSGRDRNPDWPGDLDGHSQFHRRKDMERALKK